MFTRVLRLAALVLALGSFSAPVFAQTYTLNSTTLSSAATATDATFALTSASAASGSSFGSVAVGQFIFVDGEFVPITAVSSTTITVTRTAGAGRRPNAHPSGQVVYIGPGNAFQRVNPPLGGCTVGSQGDPWINVDNGQVWRCLASQWENVVDTLLFVPASACVSSVSGNSTGTNGLTSTGASVTAVMQAQTSATGTNTHTYSCAIPVPTRVNVSRAAYLADVTFFYGVQGTALGTQVTTLASGTLNSVIVFGKITMPTAGASETASTVAPVRADAGTAAWTPAVASFNTATTTAGAFYSEKFAPATPFALAADGTQYLINIALLGTATSATTTNTPGFLVHYYTTTGY